MQYCVIVQKSEDGNQPIAGKKILSKAISGSMAGIVGGMALASSFMGIDSQLQVPSGTFYKMIGFLIGLQEINAIVIGFIVHMGTAALIGAVFSCVLRSTAC